MPILPNPRHERFAHELANGHSASSAYAAAGYSGHRAPASRLANRAEVQARVREILDSAAERAEVTLERVLRELARLAFANIGDILRWSPRDLATGDTQPRFVLLGSDDIDDNALAAIADLTLSDTGVRIRLHDKRQALVAL